MKKRTKLISVILAFIMLAGVFSCAAVTSSAADNTNNLLENIEGSLILHCWCWNFNTIKDNLEDIAAAGYSAIQTSPINEVYEGQGGGLKIDGDDADGKWYFHYQPTAYTIGNYQLGTEEEFKAMCDKAHSLGVKVIVDVVANHTTGFKSAVSDELKNIEGGLYHDFSPAAGEKSSRKATTQWYNGLPDVKTQNPKYQNIILNYLKKCVADGADGFRFDTAKHIELPDDDIDYASNFWPIVLDNGSSFQYGEVLQGYKSEEVKSSRYADYAKIMHVTASSYGAKLRTYLDKFDSSATSLSNYSAENVSEDRLVTWIESHDTYANGGQVDGGTSFWLSSDEIRRGWAIVAARGATSLFFSRPDGSTLDNIFGNNLIGPKGDDEFKNPETVAVNRFHNAMNGEPSEMKNLRGKKYIMITRGTKGAVMINNDTVDQAVSTTTSLPAGTYTDTAHGAQFIVKDGTLTGTIKAGEIYAIDNIDSTHYTETIVEPTTAPATEPATAETQPVVTEKKANPVKVKTLNKTLKAKTMKKKAVKVRAFEVKNAKGTVSVSKVKKGTASAVYKKITVNKNGSIKFKKGKYSKKTYKIVIKVTAKGNSEYNSKTVSKTLKIKVK